MMTKVKTCRAMLERSMEEWVSEAEPLVERDMGMHEMEKLLHLAKLVKCSHDVYHIALEMATGKENPDVSPMAYASPAAHAVKM